MLFLFFFACDLTIQVLAKPLFFVRFQEGYTATAV